MNQKQMLKELRISGNYEPIPFPEYSLFFHPTDPSGLYQKFFTKIAPQFFGIAKGGDRWKLAYAFKIEHAARPEKG
ncbi:MAG: hypothetical protein KDK60_04520, partial [Chlamydiia bacterium]|nr:hypothetical protein [Chlamydiia bacterium]